MYEIHISLYTWCNGKTKWKTQNQQLWRWKLTMLGPKVRNSLKQNAKAVVRGCSVKKFFLKISRSLQKNTCVRVSFNKVAGLRTCNFIKKRHQHKSFPVKSAKFLRTLFFTKHPGGCFWMLSHVMNSCTTTQHKKLMSTYIQVPNELPMQKFWYWPEAWSELCQTSNMKLFWKRLTLSGVNHPSKKLHLSCFRGFWIRLCWLYCRFSYAETWELLKLVLATIFVVNTNQVLRPLSTTTTC